MTGNYRRMSCWRLSVRLREGDAPDKRFPLIFMNLLLRIVSFRRGAFRAEDTLAACYYAYAMNCGNQFVSSWFEFNLNVNNILAALLRVNIKWTWLLGVVGRDGSV